ncbi:molybdenum cofactor synthesis 3 [Pyrrhoderma noxium]|uniref:Molybdenum cofactor synthesis 3 n=1 Tax=Pyrrhoderma noxium TaxID=2282107 RepID=A0A286UAN5_9AGAM|nr:molybdenum cofactor synthesis 3 [Pyrrhoderma noxium]
MSASSTSDSLPLPLNDYRRYGRQMIIDGLGLPAQVKLRNASVLVVGAGGLGCPALQYLCASGIGRIGIVDPDIVEISNLQRQVLHSEATLGIPKVESAAQALRRLNSLAQIDTFNLPLDPTNAEKILKDYDVILDCTDNAPTRYLLSDTSAKLRKPLVSGAAQRLDGQLCTYGLPLKSKIDDKEGGAGSDRGPCYRCLFPKPPAPEMAGSCEETGILGAVTGVIGSLQALEAIKIIADLHDWKPSLLIYSALAFPPFRSIKLRPRRKTCPACGDEGERLGEISATDYVAFCGGPKPDWIERGLVVDGEGTRKRINAKELSERMESDNDSIRLVDVRSPVEFGICHIPGSTNTPLSEIVASPTSFQSSLTNSQDGSSQNANSLVVFVCRLGNDSQLAADALRSAAIDSEKSGMEVVDLVGGLRSWTLNVDPQFPVY